MTKRSYSLVLSGLLATSACDVDGGTSPTADPVAGPEGAAVAFICDVDGSDDPDDPFVDCLEDFSPAADASFGHDALPDIVLGPPTGGSATMGSLDVASLGCGGRITLAFAGPPVRDVEGPDFIVFENAFLAGEETFSEPGQVLVSADGLDWYAFDCDVDSGWPAEGCAGVGPTTATTTESATETATDPAIAGGDAFDLADLGLSEIRYVRIVDRTREYYGQQLWCIGGNGGFDLDAIARTDGGAR